MVQWFSSNRLLDVYVNVATGDIEGMEEKNGPTPTLMPTPTSTPETKTWHSVITFTDRDHKKRDAFTIKGDLWRIKYTVKPKKGRPDHSIFNVHVYPEGELIDTVSSWQCSFECCNGTEYIDEGNANYYIEVIASSNSWELEINDCY
jgi:hypothetical protein